MGAKLFINRKYFFTVEKNEQKYYFLKPQFQKDTLPEILEAFGTLPLPTYLKKTPLTHHELKKQYQTIFAYKAGSVAAPTASLHFTKRLISKLQKHSIEIAFVTLHVNEGTFAPIEEDNIKSNSLHKEYFEIDKQTADFLNNARKEKRPIIAVGTTVVRTLESASDTKGVLTTLQGTTDLFIREGYTFRFTDGIITNFHVPRSSLMMLVSAFVGHTVLLNLYRYAIQHKFRFFSFGDGMLILPRS